ncbi:lysophospholipid acyltransferase family protein [Vibrio amylolyticus]|uniref:lysophospholipid acyltransferase family protein n=1 Tax=Vibrio amylolyticus TaxID=2847292 RepID=UPI00354D8BA2
MDALFTKLNQYWRVIATGFCFSVFGIGGLWLSFVFIPLIHLFNRDKTEQELQVQQLIQQSFHLFCRLMRYTGAIDYRIEGEDLLTQDRNCLIVANHPSLIDYVLIASLLKQCDCLVKSAIWSNMFMKHVVKGAGYIPNEAPEDLLEQCEHKFNQGNVLLVFPEGTRTNVNSDIKLQRGAAQIAVRTERDLRIIHISVTPSFLTKETKWYQVPKTKPLFLVEVKDKVEVAPFIEQTSNATLAARKLNEHLTSAIFPKNIQIK